MKSLFTCREMMLKWWCVVVSEEEGCQPRGELEARLSDKTRYHVIALSRSIHVKDANRLGSTSNDGSLP